MAGIPRLDIPSTMNKPGPWVIQPIYSYSDGDHSRWRGPPYRAISNDAYRVKIGAMWAEQKGMATAGINYYLDRLPDGYQLMDYPKPGDDSLRYKRLFGHPSGRFYDSQVKFFSHFLWLMGGMQNQCHCILCDRGKKPEANPKPASAFKPKPRVPRDVVGGEMKVDSNKRAKPVPNYYDRRLYEQRDKRVAKPAEQAIPFDEEGTLDIWKTLIQLLYRYRESRKSIDEDIEEKTSPDWRAEHNGKYGDSFNVLGSHLTHVLLQHSFVPRIGELVLWCPDHPDDVDIVYSPDVRGYQFYSAARQMFHGFPRWRAGVVTQCPSIDDNIDFPDVLCVVDRRDSLNRAGFRVETFPDPNNEVDKSASKQYKYVPLRQIRPLNQWQNVLRGIPEKKLDPSIQYALTCTVSVSLLEKYRFAGKWPEASIFCKGIYIGAELLLEGDAVRILPTYQTATAGPTACTDVLVISSIRLHLHNIDEGHLKNTSPHICSRSSITLIGKGYTLDPFRDYTQTSSLSTYGASPQPITTDVVKYALPTVGASAYGNWYALHDPGHKYEITHDRVLGRLYESGTIGMWSGTLGNRATSKIPPSLSYDLSSVLAGRRYATLTDERIPEASDGMIRWFWADTRVQALSVETVNGLEVGAYDLIRDARTTQAWRARLKIIDGAHTLEDSKDSMLAKQKGRPRGSRVVHGMVVGPDEESEAEEIRTPANGNFSETTRSMKGIGGMVGAGAALQGDDDEEIEENDENGEKGLGKALESEETDEDESARYMSKVSIMEQNPGWKSSSFSVLNDPDMDVRPIAPKKRSTTNRSPEIHGPTKARKSAGGSEISSSHAGRYDSSIMPTVRQEMGGDRWKGKGRSDNVRVDAGTPFRSVERDSAIIIAEDDAESNGEDDEEEAFYAAENFVEPEPKDDDDYDEDEDGGDFDVDDEDVEDVEEEEDDDEEERIRTLANFQKGMFHPQREKIEF